MRQRAIEVVPGGEPLRWRRYDVPQHLAPETSNALRFCAVEGDLDLLDRRHRSTLMAGSFVVSTGPAWLGCGACAGAGRGHGGPGRQPDPGGAGEEVTMVLAGRTCRLYQIQMERSSAVSSTCRQ